jgi:colicin import membrane protein
MSEQKESSVLFSLKELMNLEEDRIRSEEAEKAASAAAAERARLDAERSAREAEEHRIRAEEERRRTEEQRSREEQARLEAIRVAEIEKARVEAEQRARLEAMAAQQHHERSLAAIHGDESKKSLRKILIAVAVVVPLACIGAGVLIYQNVQENREIAARQEAEKQALLAEKEKLERQRKEQDDKVNGLLGQLESAKDQATKDALQKQLDEERIKAENLRKNVGGGGPRPTGGGAPKAKCTPGDPLCSDL